ncbi:MAG: outer membrane beta-barrel protein [Candidatus Coatesbacteria bacterium]|nr:outer membrane beta-barrel protein [Candidatus Coatesbacteria bacterium]
MRAVFSLALLSLLLAGIAFAEDTTGKFGIGLEGGGYSPELGLVNENVMYGGSFSYHFLPWLFAEMRASMYRDRILELEKTTYKQELYTRIINGVSYPAGKSSSEVGADCDNAGTRIIPVDFNVGFSFLNSQRINPYISLGGTFFTARIDDLPEMNDTAWGVNGGLGAEVFLVKLFEDRTDLALVMDLRYRWGKANFGLGYTSMALDYYSESESERTKINTYKTTELDYGSNDLDLGGVSAMAGLKIYF